MMPIDTKHSLLFQILNDLVSYPACVQEGLTPNQLKEKRETLETELMVTFNKSEFEKNFYSVNLPSYIASILPKTRLGIDVIDIFGIFEKNTKEELHKDIKLRWNTKWMDLYSYGDCKTGPDSLDFIELFVRVEEEMGFSVDSANARNEEAFGETVGGTVRYFWVNGG